NKRFELIKLLENQELLNECGIYFCTGIYFFKLAGDSFNGIYRSEELLQKSIKKYKIKEKV
ncbi:MAG: hypothetical protein KH236_05675, partial [[Eubacterium] rectale]|nr:hypothetical protein [Agathobacter rectalis]